MNLNFINILIIQFISNLHCFYAEQLDIFDICSPENDVCLKLESCPQLHNAIKTGYRPHICSYIGKDPVICCVKDINSRLGDDGVTISARMCDKYWQDLCPNTIPFVEGGDPALAKELPFMALIGYGNEKGIQWNCGGSLISPRFVLSAAHCSKAGEKPRWVRLGDLDFSTNLDDAKPQQFKIARIHDHPQYRDPAGYNDIALYELDRDALLNDYVRPICLNQLPLKNKVGESVVGAGWGKINFVGPQSKNLLQVELELFDIKGCYRKEYAIQLPKRINEKSMLCAGSKEGGKDTCLGDSGGPLFKKPDKDLIARNCFLYTQVGITAFGYQCGLKNYPSIYTNVNYFIPWIESIVWPLNVTDKSVIWHT